PRGNRCSQGRAFCAPSTENFSGPSANEGSKLTPSRGGRALQKCNPRRRVGALRCTARLSASPTPKFQRRFGSRCALARRRCVAFRSRCGSGQQQLLRDGVRGLLALMSGPPVVTLLPQIVLPSPQV